MTDTIQAAGRFAVSPAQSETAKIGQVVLDSPLAWLAEGWRDLWIAPHISLPYGAVFAAFAYATLFQLTRLDALPLLLPLAFGFLLTGPILAAGFYEISRRKERGEPITYRNVALAVWRERDQLASSGTLLFVLYYFWMDVAFLLFMLFFGSANFPPVGEFIPALFSTEHGRGLLATGTAAGAMFAILAYMISVISVPMIFDRKVDTVTAMRASVQAVQKNLPAMALWAALIVALSVAGLATFFVGLAITFPLIGHSTWHAYKAAAP